MIRKNLARLARLLYRGTTVGMSKGPHVTRYFMYQHLLQYSELRPESARVLSISHSEQLARLLGYTDNQITDAAYPDSNILNLQFDDGAFDAVVSDQVLEHVEGDPQLAIDEMYRVLKPNGISLHTTCFIFPVHCGPSDYWRFTPDALRLLSQKHAEILDCGGWGNRLVWPLIFSGLRRVQIPHNRCHPAHWLATTNNSEWPIVTWILTKKLAS